MRPREAAAAAAASPSCRADERALSDAPLRCVSRKASSEESSSSPIPGASSGPREADAGRSAAPSASGSRKRRKSASSSCGIASSEGGDGGGDAGGGCGALPPHTSLAARWATWRRPLCESRLASSALSAFAACVVSSSALACGSRVASTTWRCSAVAPPPPSAVRSSRKRIALVLVAASRCTGLMPKKGCISECVGGSCSGRPRANSGDLSQCRFSFSSSTTGSAATSRLAHFVPR
mmetsp:Transcript_16075/g.46282  ORF Transcript_16075/g.46282 Transcript_16075/m.46282 type:complete len:237 (-) Transcript_16075:1711-2421(-)